MCGIAGIQVAGNAQISQDVLNKLEASLFHRGPDAQTTKVIGSNGLVVTRLAIMDLVHGNQPLYSPDGVCLIANGEIYNAPELREQFPQYGFTTTSDCEPILPLYEAFGIRFADHLRGMFSVAIVDQRKKQLFLARDPFGIKPLYFVEGDGFFAFASEIATLLDAGFVERATDGLAVAELFQTKYVFGTKTIIPHIQRLAPGDTIVVEEGRIRQRQGSMSWPPYKPEKSATPIAKPPSQSTKSLLGEFEKVIYDSVEVHLRSDVAWRLFYSGGLDSTILMLAAREVALNKPRALTIGYDVKDGSDETATALRNARGMKIDCERIEMTGVDFWNLTPRIAASIDDPMADPAVLPLYMLARETSRQGAKVAICGEGADEVFAGYSRYRRATLPAFLRRSGERRGAFTNSPVSTERFAGWDHALQVLETTQQRLWQSRLQTLQAIDLLERLPNCLLIKLDRALMANGIEGRTPFLDKLVLDFAVRVPDRLKANPWRGKLLLRHWVEEKYPAAEPFARKKGFDVPLGSWMDKSRDELSALVAAQPAIAKLFSPDEVTAIFANCLAQTQEAWNMLFYALWHSHFILKIDSGADIGTVLGQAARHG
jgi:asparagine synthase (glutamine-hydrolysing)